MNRKALVVTLVAVALVTGAVAFLKSRRTFDAALWRESSIAIHGHAPENPRGRMVADLLKNRLPLGLNRDNVLMLLGKPDEKDGNSLRYYIGGYSGGAILPGYDYLMLVFDGDGKLMAKRVQKSD